jgi:DMSO reductase family type II enzyme chaperone
MSDTRPHSAALYDPALLTARQVLYRFLSLAFSDPRSGCWDSLANLDLQECVNMAATLIRGESAARVPELAPGERRPDSLDPERTCSLIPSTADELNTEYERVFGLLVCGTAPPYETEYVDGKFTFQRSQQLAEIAGFYRAFGLALSEECPDRADHIALELEFMAVLIGLELRAAKHGGTDCERAKTCRDAQRRFLENHLVWWVPAFARLLERENPNGFYAAAGELLTAFLPSERALFGVAIPNVVSGPSLLERPEECEGCLLHV